MSDTLKRRAYIVMMLPMAIGAFASYKDHGGYMKFWRWVGW